MGDFSFDIPLERPGEPLPEWRIEPLLTRQDLMRILGIGETTLDNNLRKDGKLIPVRVRGLLRYRPEDVRNYIISALGA